MFICICNAISDKKIVELAHAKSVADIFRECGVKVKCGICLPMIRQILYDIKKK